MRYVFDELLKAAELGKRFVIDYKNKSLKIEKEVIINEGSIKDGFKIGLDYKFDYSIESLERHYHNYKYSRPATKEYGKYFKTLCASELTDEELIVGQNREICRAKLEGYLLGMILTGWKWEDIAISSNHWFWQSKNDPDFVLLKEWFEN